MVFMKTEGQKAGEPARGFGRFWGTNLLENSRHFWHAHGPTNRFGTLFLISFSFSFCNFN
jgi:hypothetical protein